MRQMERGDDSEVADRAHTARLITRSDLRQQEILRLLKRRGRNEVDKRSIGHSRQSVARSSSRVFDIDRRRRKRAVHRVRLFHRVGLWRPACDARPDRVRALPVPRAPFFDPSRTPRRSVRRFSPSRKRARPLSPSFAREAMQSDARTGYANGYRSVRYAGAVCCTARRSIFTIAHASPP